MTNKEIMEKLWKQHRANITALSNGNDILLKYGNENAIMEDVIIVTHNENKLNAYISESNKNEINTTDGIPSVVNSLIYKTTPDQTIQNLCDIANGTIAQKFLGYYLDSLPEKLRAKAPVDKLLAMEQKALNKILDMTGVDRDALEMIQYGEPSMRAYIYYSDKNVSEDVQKYRKQAGETYPILANIIAERVITSNAVDTCQPLLPVLSKSLGNHLDGSPIMSKAMLKRFVNKKYDTADLPIDKIIIDLSALPADWFPKDKEQWDAFCDVTATIGDKFCGEDRKQLETLYKSCAGNWIDYKKRLIMAFADRRPPEGATKNDMDYIHKAIDFKHIATLPFEEIREVADMLSNNMPLPDNIKPEDLNDYICRSLAPDISRETLAEICLSFDTVSSALYSKIVLPAVAYASETNNPKINFGISYSTHNLCREMLTDGKSAIAISESTRKGINILSTLMAQDKEDYESIREKKEKEKQKDDNNPFNNDEMAIMKKAHAWFGSAEFPIIGGPVIAPNGIYIVPLLCPYAIGDEGAKLYHCVGDNYQGSCRSGESNIFSFRSVKENQVVHLSTMNIDSSGNVVCNLGYRNTSSLPEKVKQAASWFKHNRIPLFNFSGSYKAVDNHAINIDEEIKNGCGYDWKDKDILQKKMIPWGDVISKSYRIPLDKFRKLDNVVEIAHDMNPSMDAFKSIIQPAL